MRISLLHAATCHHCVCAQLFTSKQKQKSIKIAEKSTNIPLFKNSFQRFKLYKTLQINFSVVER